MDLKAANDVRKKLKLHSAAPYGKSIMDAARAAYHSGDTHAKWPDEMPEFIDGREDKTGPWMRI